MRPPDPLLPGREPRGRRGGWRGSAPFGVRRFVRARLHRRLFLGMGLAIFATAGALGGTLFLVSRDAHEKPTMAGIENFFRVEFADAWSDPERRRLLAERAATAFRVGLVLRDERGHTLDDVGGCAEAKYRLDVVSSGVRLGSVDVCTPAGFERRHGWFLLGPLVAGFVLWIVAGFLARRIARPLWELVVVTRELGDGKLSSRARLGRHQAGEVGILAHSINDMAARIEKQLEDQKELLAGVSHEIRTPLARLRVLTELLRDEEGNGRRLEQIEREIHEIDDLTGRLLASSRLEFAAIEKHELSARKLVEEALLREGLPTTLLETPDEELAFSGDATLLGRALSNLFGNARDHGGGVVRVVVGREPGRVRIAVEDAGPGFSEDDRKRVFDSFYRGRDSVPGRGSLGLGLALVRRIARAHGGESFAENLPERGARVGFWVQVPGPSGA